MINLWISRSLKISQESRTKNLFRCMKIWPPDSCDHTRKRNPSNHHAGVLWTHHHAWQSGLLRHHPKASKFIYTSTPQNLSRLHPTASHLLCQIITPSCFPLGEPEKPEKLNPPPVNRKIAGMKYEVFREYAGLSLSLKITLMKYWRGQEESWVLSDSRKNGLSVERW